MKLLVALSLLAAAIHVVLARQLSQVDLVNELVVRQSVVRGCMVAALLGVRLFLVFVMPGAFLGLLAGRRR